jgi:predicted nucleotidyltransferase
MDQSLVDSLRSAFADRKDVLAAHLFGRAARGELRPNDAIELAVVIAPGQRDDMAAVDVIQYELVGRLQRQVSVVDLGEAGLGLLARIRSDGVQVGGSEPASWEELVVAAQRRRRRLWIAVAFANAIVLNEISLLVGPGGLRLPGPALEHYVRAPLLAVPWIVYCVPARAWAAHALPALIGAAVMVPVVVLAGAVLTILSFFLVGMVTQLPTIGSASLGALLVACFVKLVAGSGWRRRLATCLLCVAIVPPTLLAGTVVDVGPPRIVALHEGRLGSFVVEARQQSFKLEMPLHVGSLDVVVPGLLTWWRQLALLPSRAREIPLREEGDELVVDYLMITSKEEGEPAQLRMRVR